MFHHCEPIECGFAKHMRTGQLAFGFSCLVHGFHPVIKFDNAEQIEGFVKAVNESFDDFKESHTSLLRAEEVVEEAKRILGIEENDR